MDTKDGQFGCDHVRQSPLKSKASVKKKSSGKKNKQKSNKPRRNIPTGFTNDQIHDKIDEGGSAIAKELVPFGRVFLFMLILTCLFSSTEHHGQIGLATSGHAVMNHREPQAQPVVAQGWIPPAIWSFAHACSSVGILIFFVYNLVRARHPTQTIHNLVHDIQQAVMNWLWPYSPTIAEMFHETNTENYDDEQFQQNISHVENLIITGRQKWPIPQDVSTIQSQYNVIRKARRRAFDKSINLKTVKFDLLTNSYRPHLPIKFCENGKTHVSLVDTGAPINTFGAGVLKEIEKELNTKIELKSTNMRLKSHTDHNVQILGRAKIPIFVADSNGITRQFRCVEFYVSSQSHSRIILGSSFFFARSASIDFEYHGGAGEKRHSATMKMPEDIVQNEQRYEKNIHSFGNFETVYELRLMNELKIPPAKSVAAKLEMSVPHVKMKPPDGKQCIAHLSVPELDEEVEVISIAKHEADKTVIHVELTNHSDHFVGLTNDAKIGSAKVLDQNENSLIDATDTLEALDGVGTLRYIKDSQCFCENNNRNVIKVFLCDSRGRTSFANKNSFHEFACISPNKNIICQGTEIYVKPRYAGLKARIKKIMMNADPNSTVKFFIPHGNLNLRETAILNSFCRISRAHGLRFQTVLPNYYKCPTHRPWLALPFSPKAWIHFQFGGGHDMFHALDWKVETEIKLNSYGAKKVTCYQFENNSENPNPPLLLKCELPEEYRTRVEAVGAFMRETIANVHIMNENMKLAITTSSKTSYFSVHAALTKIQGDLVTNAVTVESLSPNITEESKNSLLEAGESVPNDDSSMTMEEVYLDGDAPFEEVEELILGSVEEFEMPDDLNQENMNLKNLANKAAEYNEEELKILLDDLEKRLPVPNPESVPDHLIDNESVISEPSAVDAHCALPDIPTEENAHLTWRDIKPDPIAHVDPKIKPQLEAMLDEFNEIIAVPNKFDLPEINAPAIDLPTGENLPHIIKPYPVSPQMAAIGEALLQKEERKGVIKKIITSRWSSPSFLVKRNSAVKDMSKEELQAAIKKDPSKCFRICVDYTALNNKLTVEANNLNILDEEISKSQGAAYMSSLDLSSYFHGFKLSPEAQQKTVFSFNNSLYLCLRSLEGISCLPTITSYTSRTLPKRAKQVENAGVSCYLDDFAVFSYADSADHHLRLLRAIFEDFKEARVRLSLAKSRLMSSDHITFVGMNLNITHDPDNPGHRRTTVIPLTQRFKVFERMSLPTSLKQLQGALGIGNYCASHVASFSLLAAPLYAIVSRHQKLPKNTQIEWSEMEKRSFDLMKRMVINLEPLTVLSASLPMRIVVDSSAFAAGAIISVKVGGLYYPANFYSKRYDPGFIRSNSAYLKELYALLLVLEKYRKWIIDRSDVQIVMDCRSILLLIKRATIDSTTAPMKPARWLARILSLGDGIKYIHCPRDLSPIMAADYLSNLHTPLVSLFEEECEYAYKSMEKAAIAAKALKKDKEYDIHKFREIIQKFGPNLIVIPDEKKSSEKKVKSEKSDDQNGNNDHDHPGITCEEANYIDRAEEIDEILHDPMSLVPAVSEVYGVTSTLFDRICALEAQTEFQEYTADKLQQLQHQDPEISQKIRILQTQDPPPPDLARYTVLNGSLLMRQHSKRRPKTEVDNLRIVLSEKDFTRLAWTVHKSGHSGIEKTQQLISRYFYQKRQSKIIQALVLSCQNCLIMKRSQTYELSEGILTQPTRPLETLSMDLLYMPPVRRNNRVFSQVLQVNDIFSGYSWAWPMYDTTGERISKILKDFFTVLGPHVKTVISDNATNMIQNEKIRKTLNSFGIIGQLTIAYCSKSNFTEVCNKILRKFLRLRCAALGGKWVDHLANSVRDMNQVSHQRPNLPQLSPWELVHKVPPPLDIFTAIANIPQERRERVLASQVEIIAEFRRRRQEANDNYVRARSEAGRVKVGNLCVLLKMDMERTDKQDAYYHSRLYRITYRHGYLIKLVNVDDPSETIRTHLRHIKMLNHAPEWVYRNLTPEQRKELGADVQPPDWQDEVPSRSSSEQSNSSSDKSSSWRGQSSSASESSTVRTPSSTHSNVPNTPSDPVNPTESVDQPDPAANFEDPSPNNENSFDPPRISLSSSESSQRIPDPILDPRSSDSGSSFGHERRERDRQSRAREQALHDHRYDFPPDEGAPARRGHIVLDHSYAASEDQNPTALDHSYAAQDNQSQRSEDLETTFNPSVIRSVDAASSVSISQPSAIPSIENGPPVVGSTRSESGSVSQRTRNSEVMDPPRVKQNISDSVPAMKLHEKISAWIKKSFRGKSAMKNSKNKGSSNPKNETNHADDLSCYIYRLTNNKE